MIFFSAESREWYIERIAGSAFPAPITFAPMASFVDALPWGLSLTLAYCLYILLKAHLRHRRQRLPPGPAGTPLLGTLRLPAVPSWESYRAWAKEYGTRISLEFERFTDYFELGSDVIYFNALGNHIVILNSMQAANDLLDKRSSIYSDRRADRLSSCPSPKADPELYEDLYRAPRCLASCK